MKEVEVPVRAPHEGGDLADAALRDDQHVTGGQGVLVQHGLLEALTGLRALRLVRVGDGARDGETDRRQTGPRLVHHLHRVRGEEDAEAGRVVVLRQEVQQDGQLVEGVPGFHVGKRPLVLPEPHLRAHQPCVGRPAVLEAGQLLLQVRLQGEEVAEGPAVHLRHRPARQPADVGGQLVLQQVLHHLHVPRQHRDVMRQLRVQVGVGEEFLREGDGAAVQSAECLNPGPRHVGQRDHPLDPVGRQHPGQLARLGEVNPEVPAQHLRQHVGADDALLAVGPSPAPSLPPAGVYNLLPLHRRRRAAAGVESARLFLLLALGREYHALTGVDSVRFGLLPALGRGYHEPTGVDSVRFGLLPALGRGYHAPTGVDSVRFGLLPALGRGYHTPTGVDSVRFGLLPALGRECRTLTGVDSVRFGLLPAIGRKYHTLA